ncbi:glutathione S-transferase family protein [Neptunomonas sp.]|uniref:glutathione S-transferase family protein n=1 Tax=Neptunomonas sp. TaxID=1971898 RepID=UPI0025D7D2AD|nr:glutathione S-transferase family protein [Neptunomonas sp.]
MLKVISFNICPFVQRVTALLEAKRIAYEIEYISLKDKPQWFLNISPHGQVPVLVTESGEALFESDAIVEYLEEAYPALDSTMTNERRAINRAWSYLASKNYLVQCSAQRSPNEKSFEERSVKLNRAFAAIENVLGKTLFFNTNTLSMVDIAWLPLLHRASIVEQCAGYDFLLGYPKIKRWQEQLLASGLATKAVPDNFAQAFVAFYLSDETFLGKKYDICTGMALDTCKASGCC